MLNTNLLDSGLDSYVPFVLPGTLDSQSMALFLTDQILDEFVAENARLQERVQFTTTTDSWHSPALIIFGVLAIVGFLHCQSTLSRRRDHAILQPDAPGRSGRPVMVCT